MELNTLVVAPGYHGRVNGRVSPVCRRGQVSRERP